MILIHIGMLEPLEYIMLLSDWTEVCLSALILCGFGGMAMISSTDLGFRQSGSTKLDLLTQKIHSHLALNSA